MEYPNIEPILRAIKRYTRNIENYRLYKHVDELELELDTLENGVMEAYGIPKDTTVELGFEHEDSFCRDFWSEIFYDYLEDKLSFEDFNTKMIDEIDDYKKSK